MAAILKVLPNLTDEQLRARANAAADPDEAMRWVAIIQKNAGRSPELIADFCNRREDWVRRVVRKYNAEGPDAIADRRVTNGVKALLDEKGLAELEHALEHDIPPGGGLWNGPKVALWLGARLGQRVHPATGSGRTEWLITSTVSTAGMSAALQEFASEVGAGPDRRIALVIDGAGWHSAPDVVVPDGVHLIFQPPYSPEVQPSEQLWPLLHEALANRDFVDMDEHAVATAARCRELSAQPDVVRGRTHFHWWPADRAPCAERAAS